MATKRSAPYVHPSRHDQVPNEPRRKRQKPNNAGPKSFKKAHPINDLKSQVRSLKRLLEHNDDLPPGVRVEKERALQSTQRELTEAQKAKERNELISRYHKIRFFDRQKATKRLKRARKDLQAHEVESEARTELVKAVEDAEVDVNYAQYFPLEQPYVSLFPRQKPEGDAEDVKVDVDERKADVDRKGDQNMWQRVKQCMADGTLNALREGKLTQQRDEEIEDPPKDTVSKKKKKKTAYEDVRSIGGLDEIERNGGKVGVMPHDDESDGGFFE